MNSVLNNIIDIASNVKILGVGEASHGLFIMKVY